MSDARGDWQTTTHDWTRELDREHLERVRSSPEVYAPGGVLHLLLEVLAYAVDEAAHSDAPRAVVTLHTDGSVSVVDNGRGTDTRTDEHGRPVRKPVMATRDVRFFDHPGAQTLADGHPRRGMSVVAALSDWLEHTNRRTGGSWTQRYEQGVPVTGLVPAGPAGTTGTTGTTGTEVRFRVAQALAGEPHELAEPHGRAELAEQVRRRAAAQRPLAVRVVVDDEGAPGRIGG